MILQEPVIEAEMIGEDLQFVLNFGEEVISPYNLKELFRQVVECPKPVSVALKKFVRKIISVDFYFYYKTNVLLF